MSTEDINKVVVTLHKGVDVDAFIEEMNGLGRTSPYVPERAVEIYNIKEDSLRNVDFVMTRAEMKTLRNDPRVQACRWGTKAENDMIAEPFTLDSSRPYTRTNTYLPGSPDMPWQLLNTYKTTNQFTTSTNVSYAAKYTALGAGVDFVIQDTGLQVDHPEFTDSNGVSRVQMIDWYAATGIPGSMPANFYKDTYGHGTHCAGTAVGKYYGFAKEALIYVMTILSNATSANVPVSQSFNLIRQWHLNKPVDPVTGYKRPTVVNMSWGYGIGIGAVTGGVYRGTPWSGGAPQNQYGVITGNGRMPIIVDSVQADVDDCLDAGVILIGASGNNRYKIDAPGGVDYDNVVYYGDPQPYYYMRGMTPMGNPDIMKIGAVALQNTPEKKATFSCTGPGVPFYIGGDYIQSACSNVTVFGPPYPVTTYSFNPAYKSAKVSGTSMASPGAAGLACVILGSRPWYTQKQVQQWLSDNSISNRLQDNNNGYDDPVSLQGGPNKVMYHPWVEGSFPAVIQHTSPAQVDQNPEFTATLHGKL